MEEEAKKLKTLIEASNKILITSHISPDPDSISSVSLFTQILRKNFPNKQTSSVFEEAPSDLGFIDGYKDIEFGSLLDHLRELQPNLFVLLDGNNFERCSRHDGAEIRDYTQTNNIKVIIIDHHELAGKDEAQLFINRGSAAVVQDVYEICFDELGLDKPENAEQTAMTGFYADTGGFVYVKAGTQDRIFGFAEKLVARGADIEEVKNRLEAYTEDDMRILSQLSANVTHGDGYSYSFISDEFISSWTAGGRSILQLQRPTNTFLNNYIRNIEGRRWGFIVYKNVLQGDNYYSASFRSQGGVPDVSAYASALGGGGHKPAAGAKFEAASLEDALAKVKSIIDTPS
jgi:bifunctional oligoribonuclease and PAP phosphatase NrnA